MLIGFAHTYVLCYTRAFSSDSSQRVQLIKIQSSSGAVVSGFSPLIVAPHKVTKLFGKGSVSCVSVSSHEALWNNCLDRSSTNI